VTLKQTFTNPSDIAINETKYVFPVPARAAVCAFEMHFADGRRIIGVSKEKAQAAREYQAAVQAGKAAALVDWVTDDST
jgi:Vault protein inter-alpha-trypsin domain